MKILYVGNIQGLNNIDKYYLTEKRLVNGFTRLGHNVCTFNDRDQSRYASFFRSQSSGKHKMNAALIKACESFKPDLIMLSHCKNVENKTLSRIRKSMPDIKIAYTNVDPLSVQQNINDIKQRTTSADTIFVTTAGKALEQFNRARAKTYFFPNLVDHAIDIEKSFENDNADIDLLFLGRALNHQYDHRKDLAIYLLAELSQQINVHIGGLGINDNTVYGDDYLRLLGRSKMGICLNKTQDFYLYASDRMSHYMAAGILCFIPQTSGFDTILGDDTFVSFSGHEDLLGKINHYSAHPKRRKDIAAAGYNKIHDLFGAEKVCQFILDMTFGKAPQNNIWHTKDMARR